MNVAKVISDLVDRLIKEWGYVPTQEEIMQAYIDGELMLSDNEEDILASMIKQDDKMNLDKMIEELYIDWFNNFLTVARFASYYGISEKLAIAIIEEGRIRHALNEL